MKVLHWNATKENQPMTGVKRYEDELFSHIKQHEKATNSYKLQIKRIRRNRHYVVGNTFVSWFLKYRCYDSDIVHATDETITPVINFRRPKKFVVTSHGLIPLTYPSAIEDLTTKIQWKLTPNALEKADRIIAISKFTESEIMRIASYSRLKIEKDKIDVVYHGVDHSIYRPMDKEECKNKMGLEVDAKHILVISSNLEQKRMDIVKKVSDWIWNNQEGVKILKAGYGQSLQGNNIINTGWVPEENMPLLINAADVYFHPSEYESFGLPILEAMACGVPVVTSNRTSIPEVVGFYENMVDLDSEDYIEDFAEKLCKALGKNIDRRALKQSKRFSWEKTAKETIKVYEEIMV